MLAFRSSYPDLDETCCEQIDQIYPRGSQSRQPDGTIPLERVAALGYRALSEAVRLTPVQVKRIAGEMNVIATSDDVSREVTARICTWLVERGYKVAGWPPPPKRFPLVNSFSVMSERSKALLLIETIHDGHRALYKQERDWLVGVLRKITD